jgi:hypothetical protein
MVQDETSPGKDDALSARRQPTSLTFLLNSAFLFSLWIRVALSCATPHAQPRQNFEQKVTEESEDAQ